jgi:hypothetical protein
MTQTAPATAPAEAAPKGLVSRIFGVFFSPRATFADVAARPKVFGALVIGLVIVVAAMFILFSTDAGQQAFIDQQLKARPNMPEQQIAQMERIAPFIRYIVACGYLVFIPIVLAIASAILLGIFNAFAGGDATFKQVFAVMAHAGLITVLQTLFVVPLDYARETLTSPTTIGVFLPFLDENSFAARLLGTIDLFQIWWLFTLSIGLAVLYKRRTAPVATSLLTVYAVIILAIAAVRSALS